MSEMMRYIVTLEQEDDGGYHAFVPTLKGCHSQGETVDEAALRELIRAAVALNVESKGKAKTRKTSSKRA